MLPLRKEFLCVEKIAGHQDRAAQLWKHSRLYVLLPRNCLCWNDRSIEAKEKGYDVKVGKFPFSASGKAQAGGNPKEGFVKVIFDAKYGEWLGCHMIGVGVT